MNAIECAHGLRVSSAWVVSIKRLLKLLPAISISLLMLGSLLPSTSAAQSAPPSLIVKLASGLSAMEQDAVIARNGGVEISKVAALRLHVVQVDAGELQQVLDRYRADPQVVRAEVNKTRQSDAVPSDPLYSSQWALPRIGWDQVFGSGVPLATSTVAVLDTGIDATHPDLNGNVVPGMSVFNGSDGMTDPNGHGTMVAGVVAARTNTSPANGMAGVGYSAVKLMPVTVLDAGGLGQDSDVIAGVVWATDHGADVILMAFSNPGFSDSLQEAIDYAWSNNVVLVAAVGNDGLNSASFPAGDRGVIGVSATDENDQLASFSNYGPSAFLAGPGTNILSTELGGGYGLSSGTSASAAFVAGAAAQLMAFDPMLTNGVVVGRLARTADPAGTQTQTGNGRINIARAFSDTGTEFVEPNGAAPVGGGGPFVGPYVAAARSITITFAAGTGTGQVQIGASSGAVSFNTTGGNRCDTPPASGSENGTLLVTINGTCTSLSSSVNGATVTVTAIPNGSSFFGGWSSAGGDFATCDLSNTTCSKVLGGGQNSLTVTFTAKANQTITGFAPTSPITFIPGGTFPLSATGGASGNPVTFASTTPAVCTVSGSTATIVAAGTCSLTADQAGNANYNAAPQVSATVAINKANQTITGFAPASPITYSPGGTFALSATGGASGNPVIFASTTPAVCTVSGSTATIVAAGTCSLTADHAGNANYNAALQVSATVVINKANQTISGFAPASPITFIPGGTFPLSATGGASGNPVTFASTTPAVCTVSGSTATIVAAGTCSLTADQAGNANYNAAPQVSATVTINKANQTITGFAPASPITYSPGGTFALSATGGASGNPITFASTTPAVCTVSGSTASIVAAGTCSLTADQAGNVNYNAAPQVSATVVINKANQTITFGALAHKTYGDAPFALSAIASSSLVVSFSSQTMPTCTVAASTVTIIAAGTCTIRASQIGNANYNPAPDVDQTFTINKANATCTVTGYTGTYDGAAHGATGSCTGVGGPSDVLVGLSLGTSFSNFPGGTANWTFTGGTNYNDQNGTAAIVINKASATCSVTGYTGTYDGAAHGASGSCTGVAGDPSATGSSLSLGASFTNFPGGTASWTFTGGTNYNDQNGTAAIVINKASATCSVTGYTGTYDGAAHGATGSCTGVAGDPSATGSSLSLGASFTNFPGGTANWTFTGGTNYSDQNGTAAIVINKASATCSVTGYTGTYDGAAHGATGSCTGVAGDPSATGSSLSLGASFTNFPGGTASWTFTGGTNYNNQNGTAAIVINKASATCTVTGYTGNFDGAAHGATGSCTGVGGPSDVLVGLSLGASFSNFPGGTASWTFTGGTNYNDQNGTAAIVINKASATCTVTGYTGTYDGAAHGAAGSCTGVAGDPSAAGSSLNLGASFTNFPGGTASWTFTGGTNYNNQNGTAAIVINKASATCTVTGYTGTYDGAAHGAAGGCTGVAGDPSAAGSSLNLGASFTNFPGGTASWTFTGGTNYNNQNGTAAIVINKKPASVTPNANSKFYGEGDPNPLTTGTLNGFVPLDGVSATYSRTLGEAVSPPTYAISANLGPASVLSNYDISSHTAPFHILATSITGPGGPIAKGSPATVSVSFPNSGTQAGPSCSFDWDDGSTTSSLATTVSGNWTCSGTRTYAAAGVYEVVVTVTDALTGTTTVRWQYVVIYDPNGGFITGGGWIMSPAGAYAADSSLGGKATFGFVSKYQKGQSAPTGNTEFVFHAAKFTFKAASYEWLVISGAKARYRGVGQINGQGSYEFELTAIDGNVSGGGGVDKFRIQIWDHDPGNSMIYDNQMGSPAGDDPTTALGGGSIVIHK